MFLFTYPPQRSALQQGPLWRVYWKHRKCKPKDRPNGARATKQNSLTSMFCFITDLFSNKTKLCVDADGPVTNQTSFSGRNPWKLFRLSERTFGWTSTTPRKNGRTNVFCVLCTAYCVLSAVHCATY